MWNWSYVLDGLNLQSKCAQGANGRFSTDAWTLDEHIDFPKPVIQCLVGSGLSCCLGCERGRFFGSAKSQTAGTGPGQGIAVLIAYGHNRIVKGCLDIDIPLKY